MMSFSFRASRAILASAAAVLNACVDPSESTQPLPRGPQLAVGDVLLVTNTDGGAAIGSLRSVLNQTTGGEIIRFDASLAGATIALDTTLEVPKRVTIEGPVDRGITISGGGKALVLHVHEGATLRNLTIADGKGSEFDGVGGILSTGPLVLEHSTVSRNDGTINGGIRGDIITLINSTVSENDGNPDSRLGAGIGFDFAGSLTLINSTVARNTPGAGIGPFGRPDITAPVTLHNSIIANHIRNCGNSEIVTFVYEGKNVADDESCGTGALVMLIADPLLGPLADNGGPTKTLALTQNSPAINATDCDLPVDQRFVPRQGRCDIGAFEFVFTTVNLSIDASGDVDPETGSATIRGTVQCSRDDQFDLTIDVRQEQKVKRFPTAVGATNTIAITCGTTPRPWITQVTPASGQVFVNGTALATARTANVAAGVIPSDASSSVKLSRQKK